MVGRVPRATLTYVSCLLLAFTICMPMVVCEPTDRERGVRPDQLMDPPEPSVYFSPATREAPAEYGQNVTVTFAGHLEVTQPRTMTSSTTVLVTLSRGWSGSASPSVFTRTGSFDDSFAISVVVPYDAEASEVSTMVVTATSVTSGHDPVEASATGSVGVGQYYAVSISAQGTHVKVRREDTANYVCTVRNFGNGVTNVMLHADYAGDIGVVLRPETLTIGPWQSSTITVNVNLGPDAAPGVYKVTVSCEELDTGGSPVATDSVQLTLELETWFESTDALVPTVYAVVVLAAVTASVVMFRRWRRRSREG